MYIQQSNKLMRQKDRQSKNQRLKAPKMLWSLDTTHN